MCCVVGAMRSSKPESIYVRLECVKNSASYVMYTSHELSEGV